MIPYLNTLHLRKFYVNIFICFILHISLSPTVALGQGLNPKLPDPTLRNAIANHQSVVVVVDLELGGDVRADRQLEPDLLAKQRGDIKRTGDQVLAALKQNPVAQYELLAQYVTIPALALRINGDALEVLLQSRYVRQIIEDKPQSPFLAHSIRITGAKYAQDIGYDGTGQVIAILDTGIDLEHEFFRDDDGNSRIIDGACFSNATGAETSLCPGGSKTAYGRLAADANSDQCRAADGSSICSHGTYVAGAAAGGNVHTALRGVAPGAKIVMIQVFTRFEGCNDTPLPCVAAYEADILSGLDYIATDSHIRHNMVSINLSVGPGDLNENVCDSKHPAWVSVIQNLRNFGIVTVAASGNQARTHGVAATACLSNVVGVGSTTKSDLIADHSNVGSTLDLLVPGEAITSSIPGGYAESGGTSVAAPQVAGAWAIMKQFKPDLTVDEILEALTTTGKPITDTRPGGQFTKPRMDLQQALHKVGSKKRIVSPSVSPMVMPGFPQFGSIIPQDQVVLELGETTTFTISPNPGYGLDHVGGTCGGVLVGLTYVTSPVVDDCTVMAFLAPSFEVNASTTSSLVSIDPEKQWVVDGNRGEVIVWQSLRALRELKKVEVDGTCGGTLASNPGIFGTQLFTTNPIHDNCTVEARLTPQRLDPNTLINIKVLGNGSIKPPHIVIDPLRLPSWWPRPPTPLAFVIQPDQGFELVTPINSSCEGELNENIYTIETIQPNCSIEFSFKPQTSAITPVPTLTQWGLLLICALLAGIGILGLRPE